MLYVWMCLAAHLVGQGWIVYTGFKEEGKGLGWLMLAPVTVPLLILGCAGAGVRISAGVVLLALIIMLLGSAAFLFYGLTRGLFLALLLFVGGDLFFKLRGGDRLLIAYLSQGPEAAAELAREGGAVGVTGTYKVGDTLPLAPDLQFEVQGLDGRAFGRVVNTYKFPIANVRFTFAGGSQAKLGRMEPGQSIELDHKFAMTSLNRVSVEQMKVQGWCERAE